MRLVALGVLMFCFLNATSQPLRPGFDKAEYIDMLGVSAQFGDSAYAAALPAPKSYHLRYTSPTVGMENQWQLWTTDSKLAVVSIRGTTASNISWLANFYAPMVSANGTLQLDNHTSFNYKLSDNPRAAVHAGWLLSTGFLWQTIRPQLDSLYKQGFRDVIILGHSQGGAIAYLVTALLREMQKDHQLPADIRFKTYCSAGPKPGNLYFAYDYEALTQGGWAWNVVNAVDWVPELPVSIQTLSDFNHINPFKHLRAFIKKQKWPERWVLNYAYGRMNRPNRKAARNFSKYLGSYLYRFVRKHLPEFREPRYFPSYDYVRTGAYIVLRPDDGYYQRFPQSEEKIFVNHYHPPYLYLAQQLDLR